VQNLNKHPDKLTDPHRIQVSEVLKLNRDLWSFLSQSLYKAPSAYTHKSSHIHNLHSWNIHSSDHGTQNLHFIHKNVHRLIAFWSLVYLSPIGQLTKLSLSDQELLVYTRSVKPHICFLSKMQQMHPYNTLPNSRLMWCKLVSANIYKNF
jgi:hypothetical protein